DEGIEHAAGRRNHQLAASLRSEALDRMRRAARREEHVARAERKRLIAEPRLVASLAHDVGLVIARVAMQARARFRRLDRLAQRIGAAGVGGSGLEGERDPSELI